VIEAKYVDLTVEASTYKDDSVKSQVAGIGELLANSTVSEELILDGGSLHCSIQMLNGLAYY
jgi:agmatine/peptidylarginine deiminase